MKKDDLRIVFMGTPDFAVGSLRALVENGYHVVGVVTMPDKPVGRHGTLLQPSAVKLYAQSVGLPLLQPEKLKDEVFLDALKQWDAALQIVVAFRMLPQIVWDMPPLGTINLHASLLPQYRGAAPINHAIMNGETETGVTTFFLTHEIDTGMIIRQKRLPIDQDADAGFLHDALMHLGAKLVVETTDLVISGHARAVPQEEFCPSGITLYPAPKIFKDDCRVDWSRSIKNICDFVRGLSPAPAAWTELVLPDGTRQIIKIYRTEPCIAAHSLPLGTVQTDGRTQIEVAVHGGFVRLLSLQMAGKKRMSASDFLNGFKQITGCVVE